MTVIGSVEFEASLSLKKFNQDINNLISKNKGLVVPVNAVLNFDAKNQISKVSKTGLPTLKVKVDDTELTKLNKHLELKRTHHKSVQQYFNSNPLTVKVDNREIEKSIQKVKELRNEIGLLKQNLGGAGGSKITVEHKFPTQPGGGSGGAVVAASVSRSISSVSTAINRSSSSIQSTFLAGSSVVQSRVSMNTVIISSNIRKTNSLLESLAKSLPDSIGKSVKRYSRDGLIMSLIKAPFKMAGGAVGGAVGDVSRGFFENIGQNVSAGFGTGKAAKDASKKVKHYMDLTDEYLIGGVDNFMAAFLAEMTRSGNFDKAIEVAIPRLRAMSEYAPKFEKMMQLSGLLDTIKMGGDVPEDIKKMLVKQVYADRKTGKIKPVWSAGTDKKGVPYTAEEDLEKSIKALKENAGNKSANANFSRALFDAEYGLLEKINPQDLIQGYINPLLKEMSAITVFIGKIQQNRAISGAKGKMAGVKALLPKLEEGQKGYLQVIGGAVGREGKGGAYKLESLLEPLARERKVLPVHNPDTDPAGIEDRDPFLASVLEIMKGIAPEIFANKELYNTLLNGITMGTQTVNPMFQSQAVTDALANILVALENGVAPEDISTVSYSLGGKEARALADALHILGIEVKTLALGYPEINASQSDTPNFVATQIVEDGLGFLKNVLRVGGQQNMRVYQGGVTPGPDAHAPKHYFKNQQQVADFFTDLDLNIPDVSDLSAFSNYMTMVENFTEQISSYYQALSLAETGDLDPTKSIEGTSQKAQDVITNVLEATYRNQSFKKDDAPGKGSTPEMQAISKKMIELQNRAYDALEKRLVSLGLKQPVGETREARAGELFGQIKLRSEFENGLKPFLDSVESETVKQNQLGEDSYWAADLDPQKMMMRSTDAALAANWFKGDGALEDKNYTEAIVKVFENIRKIAVEFYKSQGKLTPEIKKFIDEARNSPLLDTVSVPAQKDYYEILGKKIEGDSIVSRKDQREFTIPVPNWLKESPSSAIAYNQLLADVGDQGFVPPIEEFKAVGYGMSGAASFIGKDHVYKNEPGNPQAVASQREVDAYKKLAGRYSPLMYAADPGKALVVERVKGKAVKDILNNLAKPAKESQEKLAKLTEDLAKTTGEDERKTLIEQIAKETQNFKKYKIAFNAEAVKIYEQIGRLGKTMIELGAAHGDLASANVFRLDDGTYTSIDLGNAVVNPTKDDKFNDQATTMQRAVIDRDFWGILDPMKAIMAISKGYSGKSLPEQEKRFGSVADLPKYENVSAIPLGSEQKGLMEEYLNYAETAREIRAKETAESVIARQKFKELITTKSIPEVETPKADDSTPEWEQSQIAKVSEKTEKQYKKPEQSYHKFPTPDQAIIKKAQENLQTAQKDLKEKVKLTAKEIESITHDLKTYFKSGTLKETLQGLGQNPTGKNAEDYAKQLSEIAGIDAISTAYQTSGEKGLTAKGKTKKSSLNKERLLEENGYKILKALYAKLNKQLKEKEKELKTSVSSMSTASGEQELAKGISNVSNKASEIFNIVGEVVDELEAVKSQYNIPQSIGQSLSGMLSAVKDYEEKAKIVTDQFLAEGGNLSSFELPRLALPELKIPERELEPVELPDKLKGLNSNQQMMGLGAGLAGAASVFSGGAAQAATVGSAATGAIASSIMLPILATLGGGAISLAIVKKMEGTVRAKAPEIANVLYFDISKAIKEFGGKVKNNFSKKPPTTFGDFIGGDTPKPAQKKEYSTLKGVIDQFNESIPKPLQPLVAQFKNLSKVFLNANIFGFLQNQLQNIASQTFEVTKRFTVLENTINFLSGGTRAGAEQMRFLRSEIDRTSSAIEPALQSYKKLAASTRNTPMEGMVTNKMTSGLMQAGAVFGLTGEELEGSILAISQIAGKGVVSLEELRGQLAERIPGAMQIAARSMNMTEQELYKLISTGTLSATDFLTKFGPQLLSETAAGVAGASQTAQAALTRLNNSITEIQVAAGKEFQGPLVLGMNAIAFAIQSVAKYAGTFITVLQVAAGVALTYAAPAMWAFVKGLWQIPMASMAANMAVNGLKDTIMTLIVPTAAAFLAQVAVVWLAIEAIKLLVEVWDTFTSKTASQTWSETLSKGLQKNKQDMKALADEIAKANKIKNPIPNSGKPETEFSSLDKEQREKLKGMSFSERVSYAFSGESMEDQTKAREAAKQTIKDQREINHLQKDRVSGAYKQLKDGIDVGVSKENIQRIKDYNAQLGSLRQKASLTTDLGEQNKIKGQIEEVRKLRDLAGKPLASSLSLVNIELENHKKRINETNDEQLRSELRLNIDELQKFKEQLLEVERQTGAQTTLSELMQVLARLRVEMEMFNRVASELADKNLRAIAQTELANLKTDIFASASASLKRAESSLELVNNKINVSKNTVKELKTLLKDPLMSQYGEFYQNDSLEQLRVNLEGVDEADAERRKALEAMILLREQESSLIGLQREEAESVLALEKEKSQAILSRLDNVKAEAQNQIQMGEGGALTGIARDQLSGKIKPHEVDRFKNEISLKTAQQNQRLAKEQLDTLNKYYRAGQITAEEYNTRRRDLELQSVQTVQQVAEQELQLRQSVQQEIITGIERRVSIANALQQQGENAATQAIRQQQLDRIISEQQADVRISNVRKKSLTENLTNVRQQLNDLRDAYNQRKIEETEFRQRERDLMTQSSDLSRQLVEQDLQIRQQKQQLLLDQLDQQNTKLDHQLKLRESLSQLTQKTNQIKREVVLDTRTRSGEDSQTRITRETEDETLNIQRQTSTLYAQELQRRLSILQSHYDNGEITQREYGDRSRQLEQEITSTNVQLKDYELQQHQRVNQRIVEDRSGFYQRMVEDFERATKRQETILQLSAIRQEQIVRQKQLGQIDSMGGQRAEQQAAIALTQIQGEQTKKQLKETLTQIKQVAKLREQNALTQREAEERTADLTTKAEQLKLDLINKQIEKVRQMKDLKILALDDELSRMDALFQKRDMGLTYELDQRKQILDYMEQGKSVIEAQIRLQQALFKGEEQQRQAALDKSRQAEDLLGRLPDLQKRMSDKSLTFGEQKGTRYLMDLVRQMSGTSGNGGTFLSAPDIQDMRTRQFNNSALEEQKLLEMKTRHLEMQQKIQLAQTELQQRMNRLTSENAVMEAGISLNKAQQAELQAKIALEKARINGDPREIQNAQASYELAKQGAALAQQQVRNATEKLGITNTLAGIENQSVSVEQANDRFALQETNRKALQDTALRGGELASQGAINPDQIVKVDFANPLTFDLSPISPVVDLTSQISTKLDTLITTLGGVINKPLGNNIESLTVVSSDPTGDSRQILNEMTKARNMYF